MPDRVDLTISNNTITMHEVFFYFMDMFLCGVGAVVVLTSEVFVSFIDYFVLGNTHFFNISVK